MGCWKNNGSEDERLLAVETEGFFELLLPEQLPPTPPLPLALPPPLLPLSDLRFLLDFTFELVFVLIVPGALE